MKSLIVILMLSCVSIQGFSRDGNGDVGTVKESSRTSIGAWDDYVLLGVGSAIQGLIEKARLSKRFPHISGYATVPVEKKLETLCNNLVKYNKDGSIRLIKDKNYAEMIADIEAYHHAVLYRYPKYEQQIFEKQLVAAMFPATSFYMKFKAPKDGTYIAGYIPWDKKIIIKDVKQIQDNIQVRCDKAMIAEVNSKISNNELAQLPSYEFKDHNFQSTERLDPAYFQVTAVGKDSVEYATSPEPIMNSMQEDPISYASRMRHV